MKRDVLYYWWLVAFGLASIAVARDPWFHFRSVDDFFVLPHLASEFGVLIALCLLVIMMRGGTRGRALYTALAGFCILLIGVAADRIYHGSTGIAAIAWNPAHFILSLGMLLLVLGIMRQLIKDASYAVMPVRSRDGLLMVFSIILLGFLWIPLLQQELPVIIADLTILPNWFYALYAGLCMGFVFKLVHDLVPRYGSVMSVAGGYLVCRLAVDFFVPAGELAVSMIPYFLMLSAVLFECAYPFFMKREKGVFSVYAMALLLMVPLASIALIDTYPPIHPAISLASLVWALGSASIGIILARPFQFVFFPHANETEL
ncbi:MAG: hypothetical protein Q8Q94_04325 [bacterium]|nr:hypothetical protein [bacterium]MDZ4299896.1 hypothetical protein [Candidatus Sungbacteria bacterium]